MRLNVMKYGVMRLSIMRLIITRQAVIYHQRRAVSRFWPHGHTDNPPQVNAAPRPASARAAY